MSGQSRNSFIVWCETHPLTTGVLGSIVILVAVYALKASDRHVAMVIWYVFGVVFFAAVALYYGRHSGRAALVAGLATLGGLWNLIRELAFPRLYPHYTTASEWVGGFVALVGVIIWLGPSRTPQKGSDAEKSN